MHRRAFRLSLPAFLFALVASAPVLASVQAPEDRVNASAAKRVAADSPYKLGAGTQLIVPAGWSIASEEASAVTLESPEGGSRVYVYETKQTSADTAVAATWQHFLPQADRKLRSTTPLQDADGWDNQQNYVYETSPDEKRSVTAQAMHRGDLWVVRLIDVSNDVAGKREADLALLREEALPPNFVRESFAGRTAHPLDAARLDALRAFIRDSQKTLNIPGVSIGVVQNGKVLMAEGFGVRELGKPEKVDADSLYLIASNTKSLTTLMLGKLVDEKVIRWDEPVTQVLPDFRLGDADTTKKVQIKHLLCACTGLPRHDLEWLLSPPGAPATLALSILSRMQPTSKFGETYQYSNPIAAAAGLVGGHAAYPDLEIGAGYDQAMATRVFKPLGMTRTTFDFARATRGNYAHPYALNQEAQQVPVNMAQNEVIHAIRPAGGAWSNVNDLLKYVGMEAAGGVLPDGSRYIQKSVLEARTAPQVKTRRDSWYGMGLETDARTGVRMVFHGGRMRGYRSNIMWLPEYNVGAVILTNADSGDILMDAVPRRLLELLFDGKPEAQGMVTFAAKSIETRVASARRSITLPADPAVVSKLASHYHNDLLGDIRVERSGGNTRFNFGAWQAPIASRSTPDGGSLLVVTSPGWWPELVMGNKDGKRTLTIRDAQHEYVFTEAS
ncbi:MULTISPECIES: serine hydrolase domain-containing protein [Dyella]|uniref:serine hydrolase domain-containing protein n=1 Tax=Dyella TaxID=231454 RepID=UPI0013F16719|nr:MULTISPECIES: serine hydrolase domain-containing protein [Dyella]